MGKKRGRKDGMSTSEYNAFIKGFQIPCSKESCDGTACKSVFSWGAYLSCNKCNRAFGWEDGRGSSISKKQYEALAERGKNRPAKGAGSSCPAEEDEMAKVTKKKVAKKKAAKKAGKKKATKKKGAVKKATKKGPSVCSLVRELALKNKKMSVEDIAAAIDKKHPDITYSMATVKAQTYRARKGLDASGRKKS